MHVFIARYATPIGCTHKRGGASSSKALAASTKSETIGEFNTRRGYTLSCLDNQGNV